MKSKSTPYGKKVIVTHLRRNGLIIDSNDELWYVRNVYKIRRIRRKRLPGQQLELNFDF